MFRVSVNEPHVELADKVRVPKTHRDDDDACVGMGFSYRFWEGWSSGSCFRAGLILSESSAGFPSARRP